MPRNRRGKRGAERGGLRREGQDRVRAFPCAVNGIEYERPGSKGKSPPATSGKALYFGLQAKFRLRANSLDRSWAEFGRRDQDWTARRARSAQAAERPPSTPQRVKNNCNPHMGP